MARGNCTFRQRDVMAAVKAVVDAGVQVARVEVNKDGNITIIAATGNMTANSKGTNEWDEEPACRHT